jgi:hypothetical protein
MSFRLQGEILPINCEIPHPSKGKGFGMISNKLPPAVS